MHKARLAVAALIGTFVVGGCGDSTGPAGDPIDVTPAEAAQIQAAVFTVLGTINWGASPSQAAPGLSLSGPAIDISADADCPQGGTVEYDGSYNTSGSNGYEVEVDLDFNACQSQGHTIDGTLSYDVSGTSQPLSLDYSMTGTLTVTLPDDRSGSCTFNLSITYSGNAYTYSGTACGQSIT